MKRVGVILLLLGLQPSASGDELADLLNRMEQSRQGLRTLRAQFTLWEKAKDPGKPETPYARGTLLFRSPGEFAWSKSNLQGPDGARGRAVLTGTEFLLHAPWGSKDEIDDRNVFGREHHGAEWFRGAPRGETPPLLPLLADHPWSFPVMFLADLAPKHFVSLLPCVKLGPRRKDGERSYRVLEFRPEVEDSKLRQAERDRSWDDQSFESGEVWVDESDAAIARLRLRFLGHERRYSVAERRGAVATSVLTEFERDRDTHPWIQRLELTGVEVDAALDDREFRLRVPEGRFVRDWTTRPESHYQDRLKRDPKDAAAWLELAALRMGQGEWASAEEAFRRVVDLRPAAPEGYLGLLGALGMNRDKGAGVEVLERAVPMAWPYLHRAAARRYEARGDAVSARRHYDAIQSIQGVNVETLREQARASRDGLERRELLLKALRFDLDHGDGIAAHSIRRMDLYPTDRDREDLLALHLEAARKDGTRPWIHVSLVELCAQTGRKEESLKHARAVVDLLMEGKPVLGRHDTLELLKVFTAAGDLESARRLHKAMTAHADPGARYSALEIEGELVAIQEDVDGIVRHLDGALLPRANDRFQYPHPAAKPFLEALKRERKLDAVAARLLATPQDSERGRFHTKVLSWAAELMAGSERQKLSIRVQERMNGRPVDPPSLLALLPLLVREEKWEETRAMAEALLKRPDLLKDGRAAAEAALAECHEAAGDYDLALAACVRAVEAWPRSAFWSRLIQGRVLLAAKRPEAAADLYAVALEERMPPVTDTETWSPEQMILEELRKRLAPRRDLLGEIETAARKDPGRVGYLMILAAVENVRGRPRGVQEAIERAVALRPSAPLLRELFLSCLSAGRLDRAIEVRGRLAAISFGKPPTGRNEPPFDIETLNKKMLDACISSGDVEICKQFARALASEPLDRHGLEGTIRGLLLEVVEEDFFEEIDGALVRNARNDWQRFHAHFPLAWAYRELGMGDRGAAIYERLLREQDWSESYRSMGKSWIESLKEKQEPPLSIERVRSWLADRSFGNDESAALAAGAGPTLGRRSAWKFRMRQRNPEVPWLKLGAVCGDRLDERIRCLEELIRRGESRPEWRLMLGVSRLENGQEDLAAVVLRNLFRETPEALRGERWVSLLSHLQGTAWRPADLAGAARVWAKDVVRELRLEMADDPAERQAAALELARAWEEANAPLRALLALARAGEGPHSGKVLVQRTKVRSLLPKDLFTALKNAELPMPTGAAAVEVRRLIQDLGSDEFDVRQAAHRGLIWRGESAIPSLLELVDSPNVDLQSHAREILRALVGD